jgi:hypothetical protein
MGRIARSSKGPVHLAVALTVLCAQAAGVGCCGGDLHDAGSGRAHFHVGAFVEHTACAHDHHHEDEGTGAFPAADHDADAVYVSFEVGTTGPRVTPPTDVAATGLDNGLLLCFTPVKSSREGEPTPGPAPPSCPTFLRHCALLF